MQLVLDDDRMNPGLVARFMDVATYDQGSDMVRLESHILNGVLSRKEMISKGIEVAIPDFMQGRLYTPENEISVFDMNEFPHQASGYFPGSREVALLLPTSISSESSIKHKEIDHPVIADSVPLPERKILGIYLSSRCDQLYGAVQLLCATILKRRIPIVYDKGGFGKYEMITK